MVAGFMTGLFTTVIPVLTITDFGIRLMVITGITTVIWVAVMYLTPPEKEATLEAFYRKVRPGGPGWKSQQAVTGLMPMQELGHDVLRSLAAAMLLLGLMFGTGAVLLQKWEAAMFLFLLTLAGGVGLGMAHRRRPENASAKV